MISLHATGETLPDAYHNAIVVLDMLGDVVPCPAYSTTMKEICVEMIVEEPLREPRISRMMPCGPRELEQYRMEILDGILDFEVLAGNWAYTYHQRMGKQIDFVVEELKRDPWSRRAVIDIRTKNDMKRESPACLQHIQYLLRAGKLDCFVLFRSNDAVKAAYMNAFALICLQEQIAEKLGVEVGKYIHRANSFHCYERDFSLLDSYVQRMKGNAPLTYRYDGDWKELMEEERPHILRDVEMLKRSEK